MEQYSTSSTNLASAFLRVNEESSRHRIRIDARDNKGWTPLRLAVTNLMPNTVAVLLDRGVADLASFVFPTEAHFDEYLGHLKGSSIEWKFITAISAMTLVECLEKRGYELDRSDAMAIMRILDKLGLFWFRVNDPTCASLLDDEQFTDDAKKTMMKDDDSDSTTLHDLIQMRPREAARRFTCMDCYELARAENKLWKLAYKPRLACHSLLYEITSKRFFSSWALDPVMELTHCRLPILCSEMIIDDLNNEDLYNICLAVEGRQRARDGDQND
ncbi:unnamed protein product [Trichogramma brassicae]|uniref:Uncharacterized protein n=1 Tax=Trichogramma brassicae TaxID=86971 RepID=A0A6H5IKK4_9HYME|nr:unnamed protein product [Trichogramma brassicae]